MDASALVSAISTQWDAEIVPQLTDYIRVPAKSPHFDARWEAHGHIERVVRLAEAWVKRQPVRGLALEIVRLPGRTPLLYFDVPASHGGNRTVLLYGHLDKQPEMTGWREGHGPWDPLFEDGKLYGRGGADDGYAVFAALCAISALQNQGIAIRAALRSSRPAKKAAATIFRRISRCSWGAWAKSTLSSGSIPVAGTTSGSGRPRRCAGWPAAC